ncbi:interleukin-1 receptor-associated kinase 1-binding protein 1-like [Gigantopelta aegis]|uniref:interleukin-1 receptor-associated kinase 1-binding protein 1-like n=1 Tax=Gigantopelta aegis TaxID=1735272 RepID=UPI001B88A6D6|nr:interleukin-1 receptor-associated kinase 1-binding protein 1-like [Gigantopelta aegis]
MASYQTTRVFTELKNRQRTISPRKTEYDNERGQSDPLSPTDRDIRVTAVGEVSLPPDRCRITIQVTSKKESPQDAKNSVSRRLDYIIQSLQNHSVKDSDIQTYKHMTRVDCLYHMCVELRVQFADLHKCQTVSNLLVEKLDETVHVSVPEMFHANTSLESLRKQASLVAIHNAKQKAQEMARFVHMSVGRAVYIEEQESREWDGSQENTEPEKSSSIQQQIADATVTVSSRVLAAFELKPKIKKLMK